MLFRRTKGILGDDTDPVKDADVIMTAAILGFAASYFKETRKPIRFDIDPREAPLRKPPGWAGNKKQEEYAKKQINYANFIFTIEKMRRAIALGTPDQTAQIGRGLSPKYETGGVIMGVYQLAGQTPQKNLPLPELSPGAKNLYGQIKKRKVAQYVGWGAYTGFVDNPNGPPVGPLPTARFKVPAPTSLDPDPHPRWLPPSSSPVWNMRLRRIANSQTEHDSDLRVPWGIIGGDNATEPPSSMELNPMGRENRADQITDYMRLSGMVFVDEQCGGTLSIDDIAAYTHGMIQAIYKAYHLGPACVPYEIAVGDKTKKLASCIPCTLFMYALGYPPTSIHLGRGESWAPLYKPYSPTDHTSTVNGNESQVIRDLNNQWYQKCSEWLEAGLTILEKPGVVSTSHSTSEAALRNYLNKNEHKVGQDVPTVAGVLILDALTIHKPEQDRIDDTLQ